MNSSLILRRSTMIRGNGVGTAACRRFQSRTKDCGMIHSTSNMSRDLGLSACPLAIRGSSTQKTDPHGHRPNSAQLLDAPGHRASQAILQPTSSHTIIPNSRYDPPPPPPHVKHSPHVEPSPKDPCSGQNPPLRIPTGLPQYHHLFPKPPPVAPSPCHSHTTEHHQTCTSLLPPSCLLQQSHPVHHSRTQQLSRVRYPHVSPTPPRTPHARMAPFGPLVPPFPQAAKTSRYTTSEATRTAAVTSIRCCSTGFSPRARLLASFARLFLELRYRAAAFSPEVRWELIRVYMPSMRSFHVTIYRGVL